MYCEFLWALVEKGITPVVKTPENAIIAKLNKVAVSRVFSNILNNALKYSNGDLQIQHQIWMKFRLENYLTVSLR